MTTDSNPTGRQIRRAQLQAARALDRRLNELTRTLRELYSLAISNLQISLEQLVDGQGRIPIQRIPDAERLINETLQLLSGATNDLITSGLAESVTLSANAWGAAAGDVAMDQVGQETLDFLRAFVDANGLQLSDRLWRVNQGARNRVSEAIVTAIVEGQSAAQAARQFISNGEPVPQDLLSKEGLAALREIQQRAGSALLTGQGNPYFQAERVMRTELNRAYGEVAVRAAAQHPDVVAVRFKLSPLHPRFDICDLHAGANLHGLGPGVYPIDNHPWPAHPNTLSYLEPVFADEITPDDRAGRESMTDFLNGLSADQQDAILDGKAKGWAWREGHLDPRQIRTPWRTVRTGLQRKGIDIPEPYAR